MAGAESSPNSEVTKIILVDSNQVAREVQATDEAGASFLDGIRTTLIAGIKGGLVQSTVVDIRKPKVLSSRSKDRIGIAAPPVSVTPERTLVLATTAYKANPIAPEALFNFYEAYWEYYGNKKMGLSKADVAIANVPYTPQQIDQFMQPNGLINQNKAVDPEAQVELPYFHLPVLAGPDGRFLLGKAFPTMDGWVTSERVTIRNDHQFAGWMRVDAGLASSFRRNKEGELTGLNQDELVEAILNAHRLGQTLSIYAGSGFVIKELLGYYPDQSISGSTSYLSRIPKSFDLFNGMVRMLSAIFFDGGELKFAPIPAEQRWSNMGGRSFLV